VGEFGERDCWSRDGGRCRFLCAAPNALSCVFAPTAVFVDNPVVSHLAAWSMADVTDVPRLRGLPNLPTSASNRPARDLPVDYHDGPNIAGGFATGTRGGFVANPASVVHTAMTGQLSSTVVISFSGRLYSLSASVPSSLVADFTTSQWWIVGVGAGFGVMLGGLVYVAIDIGVMRALRRQVVDEVAALTAAEAERERLESVVNARKDFIRCAGTGSRQGGGMLPLSSPPSSPLPTSCSPVQVHLPRDAYAHAGRCAAPAALVARHSIPRLLGRCRSSDTAWTR